MEDLFTLKGIKEAILSIPYWGLGIFFTALFTIFIRTRDQVYKYLVEKVVGYFDKKIREFDKKTVLQLAKISKILVSFIERYECSRAQLILFSNGEKFLSGNPIWKLTCKLEEINQGISPDIENIKNICITSHINVLQCLWNLEVKGVDVLTCANCPHNSICTIEYKGIKVININDLPNCNFKANQILKGVTSLVLCPIIKKDKTSLKEDNIVGYICLVYIGGASHKDILKPNGSNEICSKTATVKYILEEMNT
jgi:hypothetical protein